MSWPSSRVTFDVDHERLIRGDGWLDISVGFRTVRLSQLDQGLDDVIVKPYARSGMLLSAQHETGHELPQSHASITRHKPTKRQFGTATHATIWGSIDHCDRDCHLLDS